MENKKPEASFRAGAVKAAVWKNEVSKDGKTRALFSVSLDKRYKDKSGEWKSSSNLHVNDLPRAALVLSEAFKYVVTRSAEESTVKV